MTRSRKVLLGLILAAMLAVGGFLWALPEIVRRVALEQIPKTLHRAVSIEDVDLNLFTGRFAVKKLRLADRQGPEAFVEFERLDGRLSYLSLLAGNIRLTELGLARPTVWVVRTGPMEFNFSDLIPPPDPQKPPSRWVLSLDRLSLVEGTVLFDDRAVSPPRQWRIASLTVGASALTTRPTESAGRLTVGARVNEAKLEVAGGSLGLGPGTPTLRVALDGFDVTSLVPYLPPDVPARPAAGTVSFALTLAVERQAEAIKQARLTGDVRVEGVSIVQADRPAPFLTLGRVAVGIKEADLLTRAVTLASIELDGFDLRVGRTRAGEIDLLAALKERRAEASRPTVASTGSAPATSDAEPAPYRLRVKRLTLGSGSIAFTDEAVSPRRDWRVERLSVDGRDLSIWPEDEPGSLALRAHVGAGPAAGGLAAVAIDADAVKLTPPSASVRASLKGFELPLVGPYLPRGFPALPASGTLDAEVDLEVARGKEGLSRATATGDVRVKGLSLTRADGGDAFATASEVVARIHGANLLTRAVTLGSLTVDALDLRVARDAAGRLDVIPAASTGSAPSAEAPAGTASAPARSLPFKARLERLTLRSGSVTLTDEAVTPTRVWRVEGLTVDGAGLSTLSDEGPGTLQARAQVVVEQSTRKPAMLAVDVDSLRLRPLAASARIALDGFDLASVGPYLPPALPAFPQQGTLAFSVNVGVEQGDAGLRRAVASGSARLDGLAVLQRGQPAPFLKVPRLTVGLMQADAVARTVTVGSVEIDGLDLRAVRDGQGRIDLLALAQAPPSTQSPAPAAPPSTPGQAAGSPATPPATPAAKPAGAEWKIRLDRFALARGTATFEDRAVSPVTTLPVTDLTVGAESITWPAAASPAKLELTAGLPGGGLLIMQGSATLAPLDVTVAVSTLDAPVEPYRAYFPFPARLSGLFSGDSLTQVKIEDGRIWAASQGNGWITDFQVRDGDAPNPAMQMERMEIRGIDFSWPNYAFVEKVTLSRPEIRIEREPDGGINLRRMFQPEPASSTPSLPTAEQPPAPSAPPAASGGAKRGAGLLQTMVLDFKEIAIEEGYARFLDRTLQPTFSQDMSRLAVTIRGLSNAPGRRATLSAQAIVGGDAALDLRGELSRLGDDLFADLVGELRDFSLASVNPYANSVLSWIVRRGRLGVKVHYRIEQDRLTSMNKIRISNIQVAPAGAADEVKRRIGLPLSLIVGLLKDTRGNITFEVPLNGNWRDRRFDWGEAVWSAVKQVVLKVLAAPFRAIGRLFTGGGQDEKIEALTVDPVTFSAGSSVLGPAAEGHLKRVADFLRNSPFVKLALAPVATARDVESIKGQEVTARVQRLQRERGIPDFAAAVRAYFTEQAPAVTPPKTAEEQLALLRQRGPVPEARVQELLTRRLEATRDALTKIEGVTAERLLPAAPKPLLDAAGDGRVEFAVTAE